MGGVPEHDGQQLSGQAGCEDAAVKALLHQQGQTAGVVDMGVGDQHIIYVIGGEVQGIAVVFVLALLQAAVDENFFAVDLQAVTAAGDRVGPRRKMSVSWNSLLYIWWKGCLYCTPFSEKKLHQFVNNV